MTMVECSGGCHGKKLRASTDEWTCEACLKKIVQFLRHTGKWGSRTGPKEVALPVLRTADGRQEAFYILRAVGIPQSAVGVAAGVTQVMANQVLNGTVPPPSHLVEAVITLLGQEGYPYSAEELFYWGRRPDTA